MPTARELLEQADLADAAQSRGPDRHGDSRAHRGDLDAGDRTGAAFAPAVALADIPELTDAVEEIEIASIVEMPDDDLESRGRPPTTRSSLPMS